MSERRIEVTQHEECGFVVLVPRGRLDAVQTPHFDEILRRLVGRGSVRIVIDCAQVSYASSAGLRSFLALAKRVKTQGGCCRFAALNAPLREIFELSGFLAVLEVHESVEVALK